MRTMIDLLVLIALRQGKKNNVAGIHESLGLLSRTIVSRLHKQFKSNKQCPYKQKSNNVFDGVPYGK